MIWSSFYLKLNILLKKVYRNYSCWAESAGKCSNYTSIWCGVQMTSCTSMSVLSVYKASIETISIGRKESRQAERRSRGNSLVWDDQCQAGNKFDYSILSAKNLTHYSLNLSHCCYISIPKYMSEILPTMQCRKINYFVMKAE